jgi:hypothetical protein
MDSTLQVHVSRRFSDFLKASSFLIQRIVLAACFQKTGCFARNWLLARAKFAALFLMFLFGICLRLAACDVNFCFRLAILSLYVVHLYLYCAFLWPYCVYLGQYYVFLRQYCVYFPEYCVLLPHNSRAISELLQSTVSEVALRSFLLKSGVQHIEKL